MKKQELILKIQTETYHCRRIFESCVTEPQVKNTLRLANSLVSKWFAILENHFEVLSSRYCEVSRWIGDASNDLTMFYNEAKRRVSEENNKIQQGYWD